MSAIQAEFVDYDRVPTRKVLKLILEVPEEHQAEIFRVLGYPLSGESIMVGVARIYAGEALPDSPAPNPEES